MSWQSDEVGRHPGRALELIEDLAAVWDACDDRHALPCLERVMVTMARATRGDRVSAALIARAIAKIELRSDLRQSSVTVLQTGSEMIIRAGETEDHGAETARTI